MTALWKLHFVVYLALCTAVNSKSTSVRSKGTSNCLMCYCGGSMDAAVCKDKGRDELPCSTIITQIVPTTETCFNSPYGVGLEIIQPSGVMANRSDCCALWVDVPFDSIIGEFRVYNELEAAYQKNHTLGIWQLKKASPPPPTYDFPGLAAAMAGNLGGVDCCKCPVKITTDSLGCNNTG